MRERLSQNGALSLRDHELLEMLLYFSIPRVNTNMMAHNLLDKFGDICGVLNADERELTKVEGIGPNSASAIKTVAGVVGRYIMCENEITNAFSDPDMLGRYLTGIFVGEAHEKLYALVLNQKGKIVEKACVATGAVNFVNLPVRKIADMAVSHGATHVILAHNHPNGCAMPSAEDIQLTLNVKETLSMLGINLLEHFVICGNRYQLIIRSGYNGMKI